MHVDDSDGNVCVGRFFFPVFTYGLGAHEPSECVLLFVEIW